MSVYGLFMQADWVVKAVMIALLLASFWSWAIIFEKMLRLRSAQEERAVVRGYFLVGRLARGSLYDRVGAKPDDPMSSVFSAAMREWRRSVSKGLATTATARAALRQRIEQVMGVTIQREMEAIEKRLGFLATVGANATFVGLFGTVWGIMNAFGHIAQSKNTSLAVVAPGISEALFATAIGLVAAIPAAGALQHPVRPGAALRACSSKPSPASSSPSCAPARGAGLMAGIVPVGGSASGKFRRRRFTPIAEINVMPLVDVMLVLLIIFMVTAPLLQVGVPVDLPKTSAQQVGGKDEPLVVSVNSKDEVFLGETKYELAELGAKLKAVHEEKPDQRVFIRGDKSDQLRPA